MSIQQGSNMQQKCMGYEARRKALLSVNDCSVCVKFARQVLQRSPAELWTPDVCFYLHGVRPTQ